MRYLLLLGLLVGLCSSRAATPGVGQRTVRYVDTLTQLLAQPTTGLAEQVAIVKSVSALEDQDGFALFFRPLVTTVADDATIFAPANGSAGRWFKISGFGGLAASPDGGITDVVVVNTAGASNYLTATVEGTSLTLTNLYRNPVDGTNGATGATGPAGANGTNSPVAISVGFDGAGTELVDDTKIDITIPFACTITGVTLLADQSGSAVIDIWKDTYANYPPTAADKITASAPPTISADLKSTDTTLTGWITSIVAGDTLRFNITSATTITRCTLSLTATRVP